MTDLPDLSPGPASVVVIVRYFAAARAAAGCAEEKIRVDAPATVGMVLAESAYRHGPALKTVLARCSYLLDEVAVHGPATPVVDGALLDVLPPFAGG